MSDLAIYEVSLFVDYAVAWICVMANSFYKKKKKISIGPWHRTGYMCSSSDWMKDQMMKQMGN